MKQTSRVVRIVVAQASDPPASYDTPTALRSLGDEVEIEIVSDAASCVEHCRSSDTDLVVADLQIGAACEEILDALVRGGPPVVVVGRELGSETALAYFRRGAAECVVIAAEYEQVLPVVAVEQVRRRRATRARGDAARRIQALEHYSESIIQNMNSALLVIDGAGEITSANPPAEHLLGERPGALPGRSAWAYFPAGPDAHLARALARGERFSGAESALTRADGSVVPVGISCSPILDNQGERIGAVAIFQDLTQVKELQGQLLQSEKMASIGQLAAGVAHEINNPMGFIHANLYQMAEYVTDLRRVWKQVEELQRQVTGGDPEELQRASAALTTAVEQADVAFLLADLEKAIRESQEGSERIRHIVQDLRDFSHHGDGERVLADIGECLDSTVTIVWPMMKHLVTLERDYGARGRIHCHPMHLKQIFMNLLVNAYQAIEERIGPSGEMGTVRVVTRAVERGVEIAISDTGCGIAADQLERIFDPFFTTKKVGAGMGLGLSTSYNIAQRHGGTLSVESRVGEGTTFRLFLPVPDPDAEDTPGDGD